MLFSISITTVMSKFSSTSGSRDLSTWLTLFIACSVMFFFFFPLIFTMLNQAILSAQS